MVGTASGGARALRRTAIALVVLIVFLLVADRVGNYAAEVAAGNTIKNSQKLSDRPDVDIGGFPFLTQLAAGDFDQITVTASDVPVGDNGIALRISTIRVVLDHVTVSRDFETVHAATASATATVGYDQLSEALGVDLGYAGNGRIQAQKSITVLGRTVKPTITAEPALLNGVLSFGSTQINGLDQLGGPIAQVLNKVFDISVPLQGIPFEIRVQSLTVDEGGLRLVLTGADLTYTRRR